MATHISTRQTQFSYFDRVLAGPAWKGRKILDFGGNVGGFLAGAGNQIEHNDYWCLDVTEAAIARGHHDFPKAHFVFYNRYSSYFNPKGISNLPVPDLGVRFDIILAFSVFTHTNRAEMIELVEQLRRMLVPQGVLAFTFFDQRDDDLWADCKLPSGAYAHWSLVHNNQIYLEPGNEICQQEQWGKPGDGYCSYFAPDYLTSLFPGATVLPPVDPGCQHVCILRGAS
jgi:SAM-dependent methyltransferase